MEKILKIEPNVVEKYKHDWQALEGYKITTDTQEIIIGIDNDTQCCEDWGYFMSEDDFEKFIGANLIDIKLTDELNKSVDLKVKVDGYLINDNGSFDIYDGGIMFVDFVTDKGVLQFVAYNEHNGYYGHETCVISKQLKHEQVI